jgi:hypothetical protein
MRSPLAEQLRIGALETRVYEGRGKFRTLGWFPPPSGERSGCDRLPGCDAEPEQRISHPALDNRSGISTNTDAAAKTSSDGV